MKIQKLRLVGYKRFALTQIDVFEFTPTATNQLFIGTNGSGKSSLMEELNPLPADPASYEKHGGKTIWLTHRGKSYVLTSTFEPKVRHSFVRDGEELNDGRGVTMQRELVKQEFGLTPAIMDVLLGRLRFHEMRPNERRYWLTLFSDADYDYALALYKRISTRWRDVVGANKQAERRLVTETAKILPKEQAIALSDEAFSLHEALEVLMEKKTPIRQTSQQHEQLKATVEEQITKLSRVLGDQVIQARKGLPGTEEDLQEELNSCQGDVQTYTRLGQEYYDEHTKLQDTVKVLEQTRAQSAASLDAEILSLEDEILANVARCKSGVNHTHTDPQAALGALETSSTWLGTILEALPSNPEKFYSRATFEEATTQLSEITLDLAKIEEALIDQRGIVQHMQHMFSQGETECPNCNHRWIKYYDANKEQLAKNRIEELDLKKTAGTAKREELQKTHESIKEYFRHYREYQTTTSQWPVLKPLWDHIQDSNLLLANPLLVRNIIESYRHDLNLQLQNKHLQTRIEEKKKILELAMASANVDLNSLIKRRTDLEEKIHENQRKLGDANFLVTAIRTQMSTLRHLHRAEDELKELLQRYQSLQKDWHEDLIGEFYRDSIRHVQSMLARCNDALEKSHQQDQVIENITKELQDYEQRERCLKLLMTELSPTEGLIAEGMLGFMKLFVARMNKIIAKVWTYPLEIKPCKVQEGEQPDLDYMFPMVVDTDSKPRHDVSEGSTGMVEIIDLAWRISGMKCLDMQDWPLFLDEFGSTMDPVHKNATINMINSIMENEHFSQMFMISHDVAQYGALSSTEVCVLHESNVIIPKNCVYNQHVTIQ